MVNAYFGGTVARRVSDLGEHVAVRHGVRIIDTPLPSVPVRTDAEVIVNSYHDQGVVLSGLAGALRPFALADGDLVEGLYHPDHPIVAVQWHPERERAITALDRELVAAWLARCV